MILLFDLKMSKSTKNALMRSGDYSDDITVLYTIQHAPVLIIFTLILQTIIIEQMLLYEVKGKGSPIPETSV